MTSSKIDLYYFFVSAPSRAVKTFLVANGIPFEEHVIDVVKGEPKQPAFLAINPSGLVPYIKDGDFKLGESAAILSYLADSRKTADHWYPADLQKRARVNEYLHSHHSDLRVASMGAMVLKVFGRLGDPNAPVDQEAVKKADEKLAAVLKSLEARLTLYKFLGGEEISIADILAADELYYNQAWKIDLSPYPKVQEWANKVKQVSGWESVHEPLNGFFAHVQSTLKL
mmetsp:Transcript_24862/g.34802  ORF Transcript_24862/g.34802 Transcript_24862/m.34802 type:complete len:227 (+) Transcript_24862:93-773(+)